MGFEGFLRLFGGLALFLYGIDGMSEALMAAASGRVQTALARMVGGPVRGMLLGCAVTALIQSSSATTVMLVGLVNAGALSLQQSIGVLMGANIGTTVTAHLLRFSGAPADALPLRLFSPAFFTPVLCVAGILMLLPKAKRWQRPGRLLLGAGVLFTGMLQMEAALAPLQSASGLRLLFLRMSHPLWGVLAGAAVTAVLQSSSASVGMLQAVAAGGALPCSAAVPVLLGQNIGTCVTCLLAAIGASANAKRCAAVHLIFNVTGAAVFLILLYGLGAARLLPFWEQPVGKGGIANFHTVFNVVVTALLLPCAGWMERAAVWLVPEKRGRAARRGTGVR